MFRVYVGEQLLRSLRFRSPKEPTLKNSPSEREARPGSWGFGLAAPTASISETTSVLGPAPNSPHRWLRAITDDSC